MKKVKFSTEISYFLGIILLAAATTLMVKADFGVSMVVAPAYILHLKPHHHTSVFHLTEIKQLVNKVEQTMGIAIDNPQVLSFRV